MAENSTASVKAEDFSPRRVVNFVDANGKSATVEDAPAKTRAVTPTYTVVDIWRWDSLPAPVTAGDTLVEVELAPPAGAGVVRLVSFPPDSSINADDYAAALSAIGGKETDAAKVEEHVAGLHATDTVDIAVVVSGEIWCVTETGETRLAQGDTIVQRGNQHAWSNRTDGTVVVAYTMVSASR